jgi:hypothetical protein
MCNFSFGPCSLEDEAAVGGAQQETTEPEVCYVLLVLKSVFSLPVALSLPFPYISALFHFWFIKYGIFWHSGGCFIRMSCNDLHLYEIRAIVISSATFIGWVIHLGLSLWWPLDRRLNQRCQGMLSWRKIVLQMVLCLILLIAQMPLRMQVSRLQNNFQDRRWLVGWWWKTWFDVAETVLDEWPLLD